MKRVMVMLILAAMLAGCTRVTEGYVVEKRYAAAYVTTSYTYVTSGKSRVPVPHTVNHPERYYLIVEGWDQKGEIRQVSKSVPWFEYQGINIGDYYREGESHE